MDTLVTEGGSSSRRDKNFSVAEDLLVISAWSNATTDPKVAMDETTQFWKKAHAYWILHKKPEYPVRKADALMQRFSQIKTDVIKFCGILAQIQPVSGCSETDRILKAKEMFFESGKKENEGKKYPKNLNFKFEHCWNVLKNDQKWLEVINRMKAKLQQPAKCPRPVNSIAELDVDDVSSTQVVTELPVGEKLTKAVRLKRKAKVIYDHTPVLERIERLHVLTEKLHSEDAVLLRKGKINGDKLVNLKREELDLQKAALEIQKEQVKIDNAKLEIEKSRAESDLNKTAMDLAVHEAKFLKVDIASLTDPDEVLFYQVMRKKIREKYAGMM